MIKIYQCTGGFNGGAQARSWSSLYAAAAAAAQWEKARHAPSEPHCRGSHTLSINDGILCRCTRCFLAFQETCMPMPAQEVCSGRSYYCTKGRITVHTHDQPEAKRLISNCPWLSNLASSPGKVAPRQAGAALLLYATCCAAPGPAPHPCQSSTTLRLLNLSFHCSRKIDLTHGVEHYELLLAFCQLRVT